jgi:hypothetical protein
MRSDTRKDDKGNLPHLPSACQLSRPSRGDVRPALIGLAPTFSESSWASRPSAGAAVAPLRAISAVGRGACATIMTTRASVLQYNICYTVTLSRGHGGAWRAARLPLSMRAERPRPRETSSARLRCSHVVAPEPNQAVGFEQK